MVRGRGRGDREKLKWPLYFDKILQLDMGSLHNDIWINYKNDELKALRI